MNKINVLVDLYGFLMLRRKTGWNWSRKMRRRRVK
jgi:hypothetical protein